MRQEPRGTKRVLQLHCPRADLVHLGLAHGAVMVVPALLLASVGIRLLSD